MTTLRTFSCPVRLTKSVQDAFKRFGWSETGFLSDQQTYSVLIEKNKDPEQTATKVLLYFTAFSHAQADHKVPVLTLLLEENVLTAVHFMMAPKKASRATNWRREVNLTFVPDVRVRNPIPLAFREWLADLPHANERTAYVKRRIAGWEGYLAIQEQQLDIADIRASYESVSLQKDFQKLTLYGAVVKNDQWKNLREMDVKLLSIGREIGKVTKVSPRDRTIEVTVLPYMEDVLRRTPLDRFGTDVVFTNFASVSQIRRLRSGFQQLEKGHAENPLLEQILFEESPPVAPLKEIANISYSHPLNEFQRRAVEGALAAEDLYVIQGPPGTGKTTVISEICLQNAKAGLRTLVASQSNLAVDNALSRLLANKDIRILRVGRTESIEEEGKRFIEENIGDYWREVTLKTVTSTVNERKERLEQLTSELAVIRPRFEKVSLEVEQWKQEVKKKETAVAEHANLTLQLDELKLKVQQLEEDRIRLSELVQMKDQEVSERMAQLEKLNEQAAAFPEMVDLEQEIAQKNELLGEMARLVELKKIHQEIQQATTRFAEVEQRLQELQAGLDSVEEHQQTIRNLKSVASFQDVLESDPQYATSRVLFKLKGIQGIRDLIKTYHPVKELVALYEKALDYFITRLGEKRRPIRPVQEPVYRKEELQSYLDQGRNWIRLGELPNQIGIAEYVQGLYGRMRYMAAVKSYYDELVERGESELDLLKQELLHIHKLHNEQLLKETAGLQEQFATLRKVQEDWQEQWVSLNGDHYREKVEALEDVTMFTTERELEKLIKIKRTMEEFDATYQQAQENMGTAKLAYEQAQVNLAEFLESSSRYDTDILKLEQERGLLEPLLVTTPEEQLEAVQKEWLSLQFELGRLEKENAEAPVHQQLQSQWQELLENASAEDVDEIRKLNVKYANVIGTTCVASARKDFVENYPSFDVVIIDEVSKATPPELLLPMLKGKKVILVGDHHQLPPLLGDDTLEEVLGKMVEEQPEFAGKQEIENLLKESLFERLYKNLPSTHKTMLAIQYRMHESIMRTISPFYQYEEDELQCGLVDSDAMRAHGLDLPWVTANNHVVWLDTPNQQEYFEERVKGGRSLWNPKELGLTKQALLDLNEAIGKAKEAGKYPHDYQKSIGVISFYGEQVKQLDRLIQQELRLSHLHIRTGTVDRFQGMEMEVILLSMVRNHQESRGDIGFANDYRRLNVALSRAKELLVLIGSSEMFTKRVKRAATKEMYSHVYQTVQELGGHRLPEEVLTHVRVPN
ncbi:AAA domain-containing protein [Chryseomicrobium palamuruense]